MRCLFIVHNAVSYYYIKRYMDVIERHFPDARIGLCVDRNDQFADAMAQLASIPIPSLTLDEALTQPWDIAFFAAHGGAHRLPDTTCKIHIQHGLGYGKRVLGDNYTYGPLWTMRDERCIYDLFFEASHTEALRVEKAFPHPGRAAVCDRQSHRRRSAVYQAEPTDVRHHSRVTSRAADVDLGADQSLAVSLHRS